MSREPAELLDSRPSAPFDRRLLGLDPRILRVLGASVLTQVAILAAVIIQAFYFGQIVALVVEGGHTTPALSQVLALTLASLAIALIAYLRDLALAGIAGRVKRGLRTRILEAASKVRERRPGVEDGAKAMLLATKGLSDIETYLVGFVPAATYAIVAPIGIIAYSLYADPLSALIEIGTMAAIPPLMIVLGRTAGERAEEKWRSLERLSAQFVESVAAIATIKGIGAERTQEGLIKSASEQLRKATMSTLYLAFLSTGVLEVVTTVAIALVAVGIGVRLADGTTTFAPSVTVLVLVPVAYLAIRNASTQFHTTTDARAALDLIFAALEDEAPSQERPGDGRALNISRGTLELNNPALPFAHSPATHPLQASASVGERLYLLGPSGSGKSTLCRMVAGLSRPNVGEIRFGGIEPSSLRAAELSHLVTYLPQNPTFFEASIEENILVGRRHPGTERMSEILGLVGLEPILSRLAGGLGYRMAEFGDALSAGERQRVGLARALLVPKPLVVLDEPTSHLDFGAEASIWRQVLLLTADSVLVFAAHRPQLAATATVVLELAAPGSKGDDDAL